MQYQDDWPHLISSATYIQIIESFNRASADVLDYLERFPSSAPSLISQVDKLSNEAHAIAERPNYANS